MNCCAAHPPGAPRSFLNLRVIGERYLRRLNCAGLGNRQSGFHTL